MASLVLVIAVIAFLSGGLAAVFIMLVIGIHKGDRTRSVPACRTTPLDHFTRATLGASSWPSSPVVHGDSEDR